MFVIIQTYLTQKEDAMGDAIRKIVVGTKKVPKNVLVVTGSARMRSQMKEIRALGHECTLIEEVGGAMTALRAGERVSAVVICINSWGIAEKLVQWINKNRPGVRVICILNADMADFCLEAAALGTTVLDESKIDEIPEILRNLLNHQLG